jgi:antitoxin component YwqK of YwqJK toxin-antitoxin module
MRKNKKSIFLFLLIFFVIESVDAKEIKFFHPNGELVGGSSLFNQREQLVAKWNFRDGFLDGETRQFCANGKLKRVSNYQ